jgi:peptidoglycan/xylan/chitin deacetylase (PgdA/CDA1 family)
MWRRLRRSIVPQRGAIILCYHRIADLPQSPRRLWVSPHRFAEQLEVLTRNFVPLSLAELIKRLQEGKVPEKSVVITFDDGYADNFWNARPLLERFGVPATVFVTTGLVGTEREFYWDELEWLLLRETVTRRHGETGKRRKGDQVVLLSNICGLR